MELSDELDNLYDIYCRIYQVHARYCNFNQQLKATTNTKWFLFREQYDEHKKILEVYNDLHRMCKVIRRYHNLEDILEPFNRVANLIACTRRLVDENISYLEILAYH